MSLLDDVSIVVTPNGYKAGELYAVVPVPTEGAEEVTNGDFATDSDWVKGAGWTISGGNANSDGSGTAFLYQIISNVQTKRFLIEYEVKNYVSGSVSIVLGSAGSDQLTSSSNGVTSGIVVWDGTSDRLNFKSTSLNGSIDNVSVKEYTAADMDVTRATAATRVDEAGLVNYAEIVGSEEITNGDFSSGTTGWTEVGDFAISGGKASITSASQYSQLTSQQGTNFLTSGKQYKLQVDIETLSISGAFAYRVTGGAVTPILTSDIVGGKYTAYFTMTSNGYFWFQTTGSYTGLNVTIDNVSVKEVTRDNVPRIDYTGGGCPHILAEPQRTNLVTNSEVFTDSSWTLSGTGASVTTNTIISPDGTQNADTLTAGSNFGQLQQVHSGTSGIQYTGSIYIKRKTGTGQVNIRVAENTNTPITVTSSWARYDFTATSTSTTIRMGVQLATPTDEIYIWGAQIEEGSFPTSYIPTSGSTVTRNQDQFSRDGIGSLINSTEGVLFVEFKTLTETGVFRQFNLSKDNSNRIYITKRGDSGNLEFRMENPSGNLNFSFSENTTNDFVKVAFRYGLNNFAVFIDGVNKNVTATGNVFASGTLNTLEFDSPLGQPFFGKVKQLQVYKTALTDAQLTSLTS